MCVRQDVSLDKSLLAWVTPLVLFCRWACASSQVVSPLQPRAHHLVTVLPVAREEAFHQCYRWGPSLPTARVPCLSCCDVDLGSSPVSLRGSGLLFYVGRFPQAAFSGDPLHCGACVWLQATPWPVPSYTLKVMLQAREASETQTGHPAGTSSRLPSAGEEGLSFVLVTELARRRSPHLETVMKKEEA